MEDRGFQRETDDQSELTPPALGPWVPSHDVQFYENEEFLHTTVANYLVNGVRIGQPIVVIATASHLEAFATRMTALGVNPDDLVRDRDAVWLEARETLAAFMEGSRPNRELFDATVGNVFETLMQNRRYVMVRVYGEMVDLLWKDGRAEGALALETMWNDLAEKYSFSLLCTYSKATLLAAPHAQGIESICRHHTRVMASEASLRG